MAAPQILSIPRLAPRVPAVPPLLAAAFTLLVAALLLADARASARAVEAPAPRPAAAPAPAPAAAAAAAAEAGSALPVIDVVTTYRVQPRDTLSKVAAVHDVPLASLAAANGLTPPYPLGAGQVLNIPAVDLAAVAPLPAEVAAAPAIVPSIERWAAEYDLPPALLKAVTWRESRWQADALSHRGAIGVGQVLPKTATGVSHELLGGATLDPWAVEDNLRLSAAYLRWLIDRGGGDQAAALAAYHQGRTSVLGKGWYSVTEDYVADVFELRWQFEAAALAAQPAA